MNWNDRYVKEAESAAEWQQRQIRLRTRERYQQEWQKHEHPGLSRSPKSCEAPDCNRMHPFGRRWKLDNFTNLRLCTHCVGRTCKGSIGCQNLAPHGESWTSPSGISACPDHR